MLTKIVGCVSAWKKVFSDLPFYFFVWFWFLFFVVFLFWGKRQKRPSSFNFRCFLLCSPKNPCFKILLFFLFFFFFFYSSSFSFFFFFCLPFRKSILVFPLSPSTPSEKHSCFFVVSSSFPFPFLIFVSYLETNFPETLFKPKLLSCLAVWFFCCCFVFDLIICV